MKKNILIGCGVIVLFSLIWIGARNLYATAETDASSDNAAVTEAKDAGLEKRNQMPRNHLLPLLRKVWLIVKLQQMQNKPGIQQRKL